MSGERQKYFDLMSSSTFNLRSDEWMRNVFFHPIGDGLRLSNNGLKLFKTHFPYHTVESKPGPEHRTSGHYIFLARFCRKPYHIALDTIIFFDEEEAFLFKMCDGDVDNVKEISPERLE